MLWENKTVKKTLKTLDNNLETILFILVVAAVLFFIVGAYWTGKQGKVNELCNKYNGELPFCKVQQVIYTEHN